LQTDGSGLRERSSYLDKSVADFVGMLNGGERAERACVVHLGR
jgi:hypothetical protein